MKQESLNSFGGGLNKDLNNLSTPAEVLTDCLNGTIITYNGNEFSLQNDMGNAKVGTAALPDGFIPVGMKEHGGIIYVAAYNPKTKEGQIGCFPSPQQIFANKENSEITIDLGQFYSNPEEVNEYNIYEKGDVVLKTNNIKQLIDSDTNLNPGDVFVVQAALDDNILRAIKDDVLILKPAILSNTGKIEQLNVKKLTKYKHKMKDGSVVESWICPTIDEQGNDLNVTDILTSKSEGLSNYRQILRSNNSGKLIIISELNTIKSADYNIQYNRNIKEDKEIYSITVHPNIKYNFSLISSPTSINNGGIRYFSHGLITDNYIDNSVAFQDLSYTAKLIGNRVSVSAVPFTKYGLEHNYLKEFSLTTDDISDPKDELTYFAYYTKETEIELHIEYIYINLYQNDAETVIRIYDYEQPVGDPIYTIDTIPTNFSGTRTISLPFEVDNKPLIQKNKIYICEIKRTIKYPDQEVSKSSYVYIYATPLYDGVNMLTMEEPIKVDCILKYQPRIIDNSTCSYNNKKMDNLQDPNDYKYCIPIEYKNNVIISLNESNYIKSATIGNYEYDWDTYFIGNKSVDTKMENINVKFELSSDTYINTSHEGFEELIRKDLKDPEISTTETGFEISQTFISDYEIKQFNRQEIIRWRPYINSTYKDPEKLNFTYINDKLHASVLGDHGGIASIQIDSTSEVFYPEYRNDDNEREKLKASGNVQKYFGNGFPFDENYMRDDLDYMMNSIGNGTIGIVAGAFEDEASMRVDNTTNHGTLWSKNIKIPYHGENRHGNAHYIEDNEIDKHDNWMLACMKTEATNNYDSTWVFLNMISKRTDTGQFRIDSFIKQLVSQLLVYDKESQEISKPEHYNSPLYNCLSYNTKGDIIIEYDIKITSDIYPKQGEGWDTINTEIKGKLPEFTIKLEDDNLKYYSLNIENFVNNYIRTNNDILYTDNTESDPFDTLDTTQIYILPTQKLDENGYFEYNPEQIDIKGEEKLKFIRNNNTYFGMGVGEVNTLFNFKDGLLYIRPINIKNNSQTTKIIAVSGADSKLDSSAMVIVNDVICPEISVIYGSTVNQAQNHR